MIIINIIIDNDEDESINDEDEIINDEDEIIDEEEIIEDDEIISDPDFDTTSEKLMNINAC